MTRFIHSLFGKTTAARIASRPTKTWRGLEALNDRLVPSTATFDSTQHLLRLTGQVTYIGGNSPLEIDLGSNDSLTPATISNLNAAAGANAFSALGGRVLLANTNTVKSATVTDTGNDVIAIGSTSLTGNLLVSGGAVALYPGATVTAQGNIQLTGLGTAPTPVGVSIPSGAKVQASGTVIINGTGSNGPAFNNAGVLVSGGAVTAGNGGVSVTGYGRGTGNNEDGIDLWNGATVSATGAGRVYLEGHAGTSGRDGDFDVCITSGANNATSNTTSSGLSLPATRVATSGPIVISGVGGGTGQWNYGVAVSTGAVVGTTGPVAGAGTVSVTGDGGGGGDWNEGVLVASGGWVGGVGGLVVTGRAHGWGSGNNGIDVNGGYALSAAGDFTLTGYASGWGSGNSGVAVYSGGSVFGNGTDTVKGYGGAFGTDYDEGVYVSGAGTILASSGGLDVVGCGAGTGSHNYGVTISGGARVYSVSECLIVGVSSATGADANFGVNITDANTWVGNSHSDLLIGGSGCGTGNWDYGIGVQSGAVLSGYSVVLRGFGSATARGVMADGLFLSAAAVCSYGSNVVLQGAAGANSAGAIDLSTNSSQVTAARPSVGGGGNVFLYGNRGLTGHTEYAAPGSSLTAPVGKSSSSTDPTGRPDLRPPPIWAMRN